MIYTLTLNPAIDYFLDLGEELLETEVNRACGEQFKAGGKGLNVSMLLNELGIPSMAIALLGGFSGSFITDALSDQRFIDLCPIPVSQPNRINVKLRHEGKTICINGNGPKADEACRQRILNALHPVAHGDWVVLSGSMMRGLDDTFLLELATLVHAHQAKLVVDYEGLNRELLQQMKPDMIKPNAYEFTLLMDSPWQDSLLMDQLHQVLDWGVEHILLSLGSQGVIYANKKASYRIHHQPLPLINAVGAGDACLAAFIAKRSQGKDIKEALTWCAAAGMASASTLAKVREADIMRYLSACHVEQIE